VNWENRKNNIAGRSRLFVSPASNILRPDLYLCKVIFFAKIFFRKYFEGTGNE
jgi:hypothetical protein